MFKNIPTKSVIGILAVGILIGFAVVGSFNAFSEYTSSNEFCATACHEMRTVAQEYRDSPFYENDSGLRVGCADCHVPKPLVAKLWRKLQASREVYHTVMGTIDTPEKFEAKRIVLARNEWQRFKASDSRECRDCHSYEAMIIGNQPNDAHFWHPVAMDEGHTCIDCHKGFVHRMPDLDAEIEKASQRFQAALAADALTATALYATRVTGLRAGPRIETPLVARLQPGAPLTVLAREDDWLKVRIQGRRYQGNNLILYKMGDQMVVLALDAVDGVTDQLTSQQAIRDDATGLHWQPAELEGWVSRQGLTGQEATLWNYAKALYGNECVRCHVVFSPSDFWATQWKHHIRNMQRKTTLTSQQMDILEKYVEHHAKPQGEI